MITPWSASLIYLALSPRLQHSGNYFLRETDPIIPCLPNALIITVLPPDSRLISKTAADLFLQDVPHTHITPQLIPRTLVFEILGGEFVLARNY